MRITGSLVSALKASTERFESLEIGIVPRVVGVRARFRNNRSMFVEERGESGIV